MKNPTIKTQNFGVEIEMTGITSDRNLIYAAGHPVKGVSKYEASRDPIFQQRPVR